MYQVSLKSEGGRPFFVITWPGITLKAVSNNIPLCGTGDAFITHQGLYELSCIKNAPAVSSN